MLKASIISVVLFLLWFNFGAVVQKKHFMRIYELWFLVDGLWNDGGLRVIFNLKIPQNDHGRGSSYEK